MEFKKALLIFIVGLAGSPAFAHDTLGDEVYNTKIDDSRVGQFHIRIVDVKESGAPFELTLNVLCKDRRVRKSGVAPVNKQILKEQVCEYRGYSRDEQKGQLTLHYSTLSPVRPGEFVAKCSEKWAEIFDFNVECAQWKP